MNANLRMLLVLAALASSALAVDAPAGLDPETRAKVDEVKALRNDISLLNLLNGLYLSDSQLEKLIALAEEADGVHKKFGRRFAERSAEYARDLTALREGLYQPTGADAAVKTNASKLNHEVESQLLNQMKDELGGVEDRARQVLSEAQAAVIQTFSPCLLPPKSLSDPLAVGQVSTTEREEAMLDIVRRMPESLYRERRRAISEDIVRAGEKGKGKVPADVHSGMVASYGRKMDDVRRMTDVDFNLRKKALAKEFRLFDDEVTYNPRTHARTVGKISHYLLNGRSTEILKKFRQARNDAPAQTELAEAAAPNDPADKVKKLSGFAVMRYGKVTGDMLLERDRVAKLRAEERADLQSRAAKIRDLSTHDEQFEEIDRIAQRLGPLQANQTSVEAALAKVGYLCARKRLPAVARPSGPYGPEDLTGLGVEVAEARKLNEDKKHQEAYAKLVKVADALAQFKD